MKSLITLFLIPLLVTILGNNSRFRYAEELPKPDTTIVQPDKNRFVLEREVKFVPHRFVERKHIWYVRFAGVALIFLPFLYFPFTDYFKRRAMTIGFMLRNVDNDVFGRMMRLQGEETLKNEIYIVFGLYVVAVNLIAILLGLLLKVSFCLYALLIYERFVNLIAWLV